MHGYFPSFIQRKAPCKESFECFDRISVSIWIQIKFNEEPTRVSDLIVTLGAIVVNCAVATFMQVLNMRFGMFLFQIKTEDDIKKGILN